MGTSMRIERIVPFEEHHHHRVSLPDYAVASALNAASIPNHNVQRRELNLDILWISG